MKPMRPGTMMARPCLAAACIAAASAAWGQAFPIVPPKLPPRAAAAGGAAAPVPTQTMARNAAAQPAPQAPVGPQTVGTAPFYGAQPSYGAQQPYVAQQQPYAQQPAAVAAAAPRAPSGPCRVQPSAERQSLALVSGDPPLPREHVPLGDFRAQQVVHSGDGRWAVAFTKLRGAPQFAALTIDLERCGVLRTIDLPGAGSDAQFDGDHALLRYAGGERRVPLKDESVR